jgi:hypothetical protein
MRTGRLSSSEYVQLNLEVKSMISDCEERHGEHAMIFISNAGYIPRLHQRVLKRMQPGDSAVTYDYLLMLERLYQEMFANFEGPKIKVDNDEKNTFETLEKIQSFLNTL